MGTQYCFQACNTNPYSASLQHFNSKREEGDVLNTESEEHHVEYWVPNKTKTKQNNAWSHMLSVLTIVSSFNA